MEILLWRHAEAEVGPDDMNRALTKKGQKQAARVAQWIKDHASVDLDVFASPARRTIETAQALRPSFSIVDALGPAEPFSSVEAWIQRALDTHGRDILIVGHQPNLGRVAAMLLTGLDTPLSIRKGAVWWISCASEKAERELPGRLVAVIPPALA